jgi:opacity protein-like surface antigen
MGKLFVGYGHVFDWSYLSAEIFGNYGGLDSSYITSADNSLGTGQITTATTARLNNGEYGIDGKLGFLVSPDTLLYARLGASFNRLHIDSNTTHVTTGPTTTALNYGASVSTTGFRYGLGVEQRVCHNGGLQLDYTFTDYGSLTAVNSSGSISNRTTANFHANTVTASYVYHFTA